MEITQRFLHRNQIHGKGLCVEKILSSVYKSLSMVNRYVLVHIKLAAGQDFILAGDFNFKPYDKAYRALTEKGYINVYFPESNDQNISYRPNAQQVLKSSYQEKNGSEPVYTNFSHTTDDPNYCATLDYIFFNGQLMVENVLELPDHPTGESYPDETHPSDHLMIAANSDYYNFRKNVFVFLLIKYIYI